MNTLLTRPPALPGSLTRRNLLISLGGSALVMASSQERVFAGLNSNFQRVSDLPDALFSSADDLLGKVRIDPKKQTALVLLRKRDAKIFAIVIENSELEKQSSRGGAFNKGLLYIKVSKGGLVEDLKIEGDIDGELFRYGILGYKDEEGITLLDERNSENVFGKIKNVKPQRRNFDPEDIVKQEPGKVRQDIHGKLKSKPIHLGYTEKYKEKSIRGNLPDKESVQGRILRSYRWKSITDAAEDLYKIPRGLLLAMMAQEGYGDPTLPNLNGDGGLGLIHIQAANAFDYGLKTLPRYTRKMRDLDHGKEITKVLKKEKNTLHKLISYDDRFHPILAVDVAARFLVSHYIKVKRRNPTMKETELWDLALKLYSGRSHTGRSGYGSKVRSFQEKINKSDYISSLKKDFPSYNVAIGGKEVGFHEYMKYFSQMAENYELSKYRRINIA